MLQYLCVVRMQHLTHIPSVEAREQRRAAGEVDELQILVAETKCKLSVSCPTSVLVTVLRSGVCHASSIACSMSFQGKHLCLCVVLSTRFLTGCYTAYLHLAGIICFHPKVGNSVPSRTTPLLGDLRDIIQITGFELARNVVFVKFGKSLVLLLELLL